MDLFTFIRDNGGYVTEANPLVFRICRRKGKWGVELSITHRKKLKHAIVMAGTRSEADALKKKLFRQFKRTLKHVAE